MLSRTSIVLTSYVMIMINLLNKLLKCYNNRDLDVGQVHSLIYYILSHIIMSNKNQDYKPRTCVTKIFRYLIFKWNMTINKWNSKRMVQIIAISDSSKLLLCTYSILCMYICTTWQQCIDNICITPPWCPM